MSPRGNGNGALALRPPPHNLEAEMAVLGAIFVDNDTFEKVSGFLRAEHFGFVPHGLIFEAAAALIERRRVADPVTLLRYFEQDETLAQIGGPAYLAKLAHAAVGPISAGQYGELVADLHAKRALIQAGENLVAKAYDGSADATSADILSEHAAELDRLADECPAPLRINGKLAGAMDPITLDGKPTPDRRWLVDGWIPHGTVTMVSADIPQMTSRFVELVPPSHRQGNRIPSAAIRWPDFRNRPAFGSPFGQIFHHSDTPVLSFSLGRRCPRPTPERVLVADHQSGAGFSGTVPSAPPPRPIGT